jgi:hypothetical protein
MKPNSANSPQSPAKRQDPAGPDQGREPAENDALWSLLGEASRQEPSPFFARNVIRKTRLTPNATESGSRLLAILTPARLALGGAICACAMATFHFWPGPESTKPAELASQQNPPEPSSALTELVIQESLSAAAEDPDIFTRDEVVAMIGF